MRCNSSSSSGVTRSGSLCVIPCTTRCPTALTEANTGCVWSHSNRKPTAERRSLESIARLFCGCPAAFLKVKCVPLRPTRSTFPSSSRIVLSPSYTANRMLDEPPFIVRREYDSRRASKVLACVANTGLAEPLNIDGHVGNHSRLRVSLCFVINSGGSRGGYSTLHGHR